MQINREEAVKRQTLEIRNNTQVVREKIPDNQIVIVKERQIHALLEIYRVIGNSLAPFFHSQCF